MNIGLLQTLKQASGGFVPTENLRLASSDLAADLDDLEQFGFGLERHPFQGVAYRHPAARLCPDQIEFELNTRRIGRRIAVWNRVGSTNDLAGSASSSTANEGLVVLAEEQTSGRGSRGRSWVAPAGSSLLVSVLLFPDKTLADPSWLTALGAVAVAEVVGEIAKVPAQIKWPNDVRVNGKKIAGVLVERGQGVVVGVGLNVNFAIEDLPDSLQETATSLQILTTQSFDRSELARALIQRLDKIYDDGWNLGTEPLHSSWRDRLEAVV